MSFKSKINIIILSSVILCFGTYFIISKIFNDFETQLFEKCKIEALTGAKTMSKMMEFMIETGVVSEKDIFDTNYIEIKGSNPRKFHTRYDRIFDKHLQGIEDEFLRDPDLEYAIIIDKNGYIPTHNSKYAKPENQNCEQNLLYCRSKRIFANSPGIKEAIKYKGNTTFKLLYSRDIEDRIWNIGAPVHVNGKHWGAFLIGVSKDRVTRIMNQMLILIITIMFVILGMSMFAGLAVMPKKLFMTYEDDDTDAPHY